MKFAAIGTDQSMITYSFSNARRCSFGYLPKFSLNFGRNRNQNFDFLLKLTEISVLVKKSFRTENSALFIPEIIICFTTLYV